VFAHGATFDDLAAVCASGARDDHVLSVVASLVDKNLLYRSTAGGATRIEMLETVREFGREMLRTSGELDGVARLHAERCARLGRQG